MTSLCLLQPQDSIGLLLEPFEQSSSVTWGFWACRTRRKCVWVFGRTKPSLSVFLVTFNFTRDNSLSISFRKYCCLFFSVCSCLSFFILARFHWQEDRGASFLTVPSTVPSCGMQQVRAWRLQSGRPAWISVLVFAS